MSKNQEKQTKQKLNESKKGYTPSAAGNKGMRKGNNKIAYSLAELRKFNKNK